MKRELLNHLISKKNNFNLPCLLFCFFSIGFSFFQHLIYRGKLKKAKDDFNSLTGDFDEIKERYEHTLKLCKTFYGENFYKQGFITYSPLTLEFDQISKSFNSFVEKVYNFSRENSVFEEQLVPFCKDFLVSLGEFRKNLIEQNKHYAYIKNAQKQSINDMRSLRLDFNTLAEEKALFDNRVFNLNAIHLGLEKELLNSRQEHRRLSLQLERLQ